MNHLRFVSKECRPIKKIFLLFISLFFHFFVFAQQILPTPGVVAKYNCDKGPWKEKKVYYWQNGQDQMIFRENWTENAEQVKPAEEDGRVTSWEFISGLPSVWAVNRTLKFLNLVNGDIDQVVSLKKGVYKGNLNIERMGKKHQTKVSVSIGSSTRKKTSLGYLMLLPIETLIEDVNGKGQSLKISAEFSRVYRVFTIKKIESPDRDFAIGQDCSIESIKQDTSAKQDIKKLKLEWPKTGFSLDYKCNGSFSKYQIKVASHQNEEVKLKVDTSESSYFISGPGDQLYFGLGDIQGISGLRAREKITRKISFEDQSLGLSHGMVGEFEEKKELDGKQHTIKNRFFVTLTHAFAPTNEVSQAFKSMYGQTGLINVRSYISNSMGEYFFRFTYLIEGKFPIKYRFQLQSPDGKSLNSYNCSLSHLSR